MACFGCIVTNWEKSYIRLKKEKIRCQGMWHNPILAPGAIALDKPIFLEPRTIMNFSVPVSQQICNV
uniref:Uncharacterized protein n=1 Tax=Romanomermis culicivorax TaxID=13658 RepID=A0A915I5T0_ROMCU